jgi:hypothetical protein
MSAEDKELLEMFSGEERELHPDTVHVSLTDLQKNREARKTRSTANTTNEQKSEHKPTHDFKDAKWEPIKEHTWKDSIKDCAKWVIGFGGLSFLLFYWELAGLMDESIAVPCMCICTALAGWGVGKNVGCK